MGLVFNLGPEQLRFLTPQSVNTTPRSPAPKTPGNETTPGFLHGREEIQEESKTIRD
jgi:hypothetical protein